MDLFLTLLDAFNLFTVSILFSLSVYHLLIFFGRMSTKAEAYNFYFSLFAFFLSAYIVLSTNLFRFISVSLFVRKNILPALQVLCYLGIVYGISNLLIVVLTYPKNKKWIFKFYYLSILFSLPLTFLNSLFDDRAYIKSVFSFIIIFFHMSFLIFIISSLIDWVIEKKLFKDKIIKIIFIGSILLLIFFILEKILYFLDIKTLLRENYLMIALSNFIFAYAIAEKFNIEHKVLIDLKNNLEEKVRERTIELELAKDKVEELIRQKSSFFVNLTHEIKTPLTLIKNYLNEYIAKKDKTEEVKLIKYNFDKLTRDIINFLDLEKLERNQIFYDHEQVINFSQLLEMKIKLFTEIAHKKDIKIKYKIMNNVYLEIDPYAADRVANNLIDNAIKYTNFGGVIDITLEKDKNKAIFIVCDNGIGISPDQIDNLFKPYYQLSNKKRNIQGIGMGLSIVKNILDSLGDVINVESKLNTGTKFKIVFKRLITKTNNIVIKDIEYSNPIRNFSDMKISTKIFDKKKDNVFIVEDNYELLLYLNNKLLPYYNVFFALNGMEALDKIENIPKPNIIISDIIMDEMDGYAFFENIRNNEKFNFIPFIFLTSKCNSDEKLRGLSSGAVDFLYKPFNFEELLYKINSIIKNQKAQAENSLKRFESKISEILNLNKKASINFNKDDNNEIFDRICAENQINPREQDVIREIISGNDYKMVGENLKISINTIKKHVQNIFKKIDVRNKVELIRFFEGESN